MEKNFPFIALLFFIPVLLHGQDGCDIRVKINGYSNDTLWFGQTYGKRARPDFFALKQPDGAFSLKSEKPLPAGLYAILYKRAANAEMQYLNCWLAEGQRKFSLELDLNHLLDNTVVQNAPDNACFFRYLGRYELLSDSLDLLTNDWKSLRTEAAYRACVAQQEALRRYQEDFLRQCPGTMTAELIRQTLFITPPLSGGDSPDWQTEAAGRHLWFRQHYFERMDLGSGQLLKFPLWIDRADYYFSKLPPPDPDSMIEMVEDVLHRLEPHPESYQYYFRYMMNSMSKISRYRTDEAFVYFVRNYLDKGKMDWLSDDRRQTFEDDANRMEPLFVGKQAPDAVFSDKDGKDVSLYSVDAPYTLMVFWLFDCSHCKKELPMLKSLYGKWKTKGLKVFSVCGNSGTDKTASCYAMAEQLGLPPDWLIVTDPLRRSRFSRVYNVSSYPRLILLDANKKILFKHAGEAPAAMLEAEMGRAMK